MESKGSISFLNTRNKKLFEAGFRVLQRRRLTDKKLLCLPLVFLISMAYNQVVELFPTGGGGYKVASKLIGRYAGVVSGSALLVDYVLIHYMLF